MPGDTVFCHYSGHGGRVVDTSEDEDDDGYDETLIPVHPVDDFRYFTALHMEKGSNIAPVLVTNGGGSKLSSLDVTEHDEST
jgi:hypothetical protein